MTDTKTITEIQVTMREMQKDIQEIKECLKTEYQTKEGAVAVKEASVKLAVDLEGRVTKIEGSLSKVVWIVLSAIISAILYLVIKT